MTEAMLVKAQSQTKLRFVPPFFLARVVWITQTLVYPPSSTEILVRLWFFHRFF